ncbi:MAG: GTPase HflX [Lachnospiraceae bacterium]|nr:GTPase HflX [Lachnospiraceae bacterium]MDE6253801.1 GTPase HflX [Lachnospiraceae bacterium]
MSIYEMKENPERLILIGVCLNEKDDTKESLDELEELVKTAGAVTVEKVIQSREKIHPGTYIGKGKIEEVKNLIEYLDATGVVCDDELSPAQLSNLENALDIKVMDRTLVILDIFASRATSREGKIQVELAQLRYRATRLIGLRNSLSRLGGGIGTRGPGEKKLEMDRRLIRDRISILKREVEEMQKQRELARKNREKNPVTVVSIVGYTNAGKSTFLNRLTSAGVLEEDKLFATLDPTTRNYKLESGQEILFTDTVGFIRKLPHHLIDAFKSTLEEARYADIIIHMVDSSNPQAEIQMHTVYKTLDNLEVGSKPIITVFNKQDKRVDKELILKDGRADYTVNAAVKTGTGMDEVLKSIEEIIRNSKQYIAKTFSYDEAGKIQRIRKYGELLTEEYREDGIYVEAYIPAEMRSI